MLLSNNVLIKITGRNKKYYKNKNYECEIGDILKINTLDLPNGSHVNVKVKCDICGDEKELSYQKYIKNISKYNLYTCSTKCAQIKNKQTNIKKYGYIHPLKSKIVKDKLISTVNEIYGVDNVFQNNDIKNKSKETNLIKYGVEYSQQNKDILNKSNQTNLKKYGFKRPAQNKDIFNKICHTKTILYNDPTYVNLEKRTKTLLIQYGVDNPSKLNTHTEKINKKNIIKLKEKYKNLNFININNDTYILHCDKCNHNFEISKTLFYNRLRLKIYYVHYVIQLIKTYQIKNNNYLILLMIIIMVKLY